MEYSSTICPSVLMIIEVHRFTIVVSVIERTYLLRFNRRASSCMSDFVFGLVIICAVIVPWIVLVIILFGGLW
jgi:hypothetical protein